MRHHHVPALDGIRGLAVLAVLLYHLEGAPLSGGFLGVSSFFTLSGFLITSLLLAERERTGGIDLGAFWGRRWRRLLPALLAALALVVALAAGGAFADAQVDAARKGIPWAIGYAANWHQLVDGGGYLQDLAAPSPLEHLWSLAIEEQFYVAFPLVLAGVLALAGAGRGRRAALVLCGGLAAVSAGLAVGAGWSPERVYLGTDTRIAEVLAGSLVAVLLRRGLGGLTPGSTAARVAAVVGPVALAAQLAVWALVDDDDAGLFRGGLAAHGVLSAVVIVGALAPGPLAAALGWRPLAAVGRVSYGVYLYHWPVYLWLTPQRTGLDDLPLAALRATVTAALAVVSFVFLEEPIRRERGATPVRRPALALGCAVALVGASLALPRSEVVDIAGVDATGAVEPDAAPELAVVERPWRVLLVVDAAGAALADELARSSLDGWEVAGVARLDCGAPGCWEATWPAAAAGADAAVVLADAWDFRGELAAAMPGTLPTSVEGVDFAAQRFVQGVDLLAAGGRPVLWVTWPVAGEGRQDLVEADWSVKRRITTARPTLVQLSVAEPAAATVDRAVAVQAAAATGEQTAVMVVGDSVAASMAAGLTEWGRDHGVVVWDNGRGGCGVLRGGRRVALAEGTFQTEDDCRPWRESWPTAAVDWGADLVVVLVGVWDASDRELPGEQEVRGPGDPAWDDYFVAEYRAASVELASTGIPVVVVTPPCMGYEGERVPGGLGGGHPVFADDRQRRLAEDLLPRAVEGVDGVRIHDLFADLCPGGSFVEQTVTEELVRPDGVHFGSGGAVWWAEAHGHRLLGG